MTARLPAAKTILVVHRTNPCHRRGAAAVLLGPLRTIIPISFRDAGRPIVARSIAANSRTNAFANVSCGAKMVRAHHPAN